MVSGADFLILHFDDDDDDSWANSIRRAIIVYNPMIEEHNYGSR